MSDVNVSVVGLGWFGEVHCEVLAGLPNVELYALCTRTESRLENLAERFDDGHTYTV
jgi:UDP-N-acetylglucosamine 3-dehydrogenase